MFFIEIIILTRRLFAHIHESPLIMILPLTILSVFAIFFGMVLHDYFAGEDVFKAWGNFMHINKDLIMTI